MGSLQYLGLTSLRHIRNGNVMILANKNLCFVENMNLSLLLPSNKVRTQIIVTGNNDSCGKSKHHIIPDYLFYSCLEIKKHCKSWT